MPRPSRFALAASVTVAGLLATPGAASAGEEQQPDFAFGRPRAMVGLHFSWQRARAQGDFYDLARNEFFVSRDPADDPKDPTSGQIDFNALGFGGLDAAIAVTSRLNTRIGFDYLRTSSTSELRHFVGSDRLPIEQTTALRQWNLSGSVTAALAPRGRAIGRYFWMPGRLVPYVGAGAGMLRYALEQHGEFRDAVDGAVFAANPQSSAWVPEFHVLAGVDIRLTPRVAATVEARYLQAHAQLTEDFAGFEPLDLSGLRVSAGLRWAF